MRREASPVTTADPRAETASTYSVGGAGAKAAAASLAFRFLCLRSPRFGDMSPFVLFLVPFSLLSAPLAFVGGAGTFLFASGPGGTEPPVACRAIFPVPVSSRSAFPFRWMILGCRLES